MAHGEWLLGLGAFIFYILVFQAIHTSGQPSGAPSSVYGTPWISIMGGGGSDVGEAIIGTSSGGYVCIGYTTNFGAGGSDMLVVKLDSTGSVSWAMAIGDGDYNRGRSVIQTSDGGYAMVGNTGVYLGGNYDMLIVKLDHTGSISWAKTLGGATDDIGYSVVELSDDSLIVAGDTTSYGAGQADLLVVKLDSGGSTIWAKIFGGGSKEYGRSIAGTSDGGVIILGGTSSYGAGSYDALLLKLNSAGSIIWTTVIGAASNELGESVVELSSGDIVITLPTTSYGAGSNDMLVIKLDSNGNIIWTTTIGGAGDDYSLSVIETSDGGVVSTGYSNSYTTGPFDALVVKLNSDGSMSWAKTLSGASEEMFVSVVETADEGLIFTGYTASYGAGASDVFVVKLDSDGNGVDGVFGFGLEDHTHDFSVTSPIMTVSTPSMTTTTPTAAQLSLTAIALSNLDITNVLTVTVAVATAIPSSQPTSPSAQPSGQPTNDPTVPRRMKPCCHFWCKYAETMYYD